MTEAETAELPAEFAARTLQHAGLAAKLFDCAQRRIVVIGESPLGQQSVPP